MEVAMQMHVVVESNPLELNPISSDGWRCGTIVMLISSINIR